MSINKVILIGNIGDIPDVRILPSGASVANFSIATSEKWKDKQTGQMQEKTEWSNCKAFDRGNYKMAEYIGQGCKKGTKIYIEGKLETEEYEKDGIKRYSTKINVTDFEILANGIHKDDNGQQPQNAAPQPKSFTPETPAGAPYDPWVDYVPSATTNGATIEQVKKKYNGDLKVAIENGHVMIDDGIPF